MPYKIKGHCIYKKDTGAKVGCTDGDVHKYMAALQMHAHESEEKNLSEIRKLVRNLLSENIEEDYPVSFNMETFKSLRNHAERNRYAAQHLPKIAAGSSRIVYKIDDEKVLKLAKNDKGIAQNKTEIQWGNDSYFGNVLARTFDSDDRALWVEMELARKITKFEFKRLTGFDINDVNIYLKIWEAKNNGRRPYWSINPELEERMIDSEFITEIIDFSHSADIEMGDFGRASSYGVVKRNGHEVLVITDYGLTKDVYQTHYEKPKRQVSMYEEGELGEVKKQTKNITDVINHFVKKYTKEHTCTTWDINNGMCSDFANDVINAMGDEKGYELTDDMFFAIRDPEFARENWGNIIETEYGVWSQDMLDMYGYPPVPLENISDEASHAWIFYNGKHYDAELPEGTDKWYELPLIKKWLSKFKEKISETPTSNYSLENWPDGKYKGFIKGHEVYSDDIDSGFRATSGYKNIQPIPCTIYMKDGKAVVCSKGGIIFSSNEAEEDYRKVYGKGMEGMKKYPGMQEYLK